MQPHSIRLFEKDDTCRLTTQVIDVTEQPVKLVRDGKPVIVNLLGVVLAETIFHPQGGGQPSDKGQLNGFEILAVRENKNDSFAQDFPTIYHFINPQSVMHNQLMKSHPVELILDVEFRKQCARSHTSGHLIADVLEHQPQFSFLQAKSTQGHHFPGSEYIKVLVVTVPDNLDELSHQLNISISNLITTDELAISACYQDGIRHIKIGDSIRMCGGTHVKALHELADLKVTKIKAKSASEGKTELTIFYSL